MSNTKQKTPISPISLHASNENFKKQYFKAYKVQGDWLKDSESDSYNKNDKKEKLNDLVRKIENSIILRTNPNSYFGTG